MSRPALTGAERRALRRTAWSLGLQTAVLVLVVLGAMAVVVLLVVSRSQRSAGLEQIEAAVHSIDDVHDAGPGMWVTVVSEHGTESTAGMPAGLPDVDAIREVTASGDVVHSTVTTAIGEISVVTGANGDRVVQAALDPRPAHEELERLAVALGLAGGLGVVLAGLGGVWLARRAVQPMIGALSMQRRFVADASHELRTPLTLLSTRAQLLARHAAADLDVASSERVNHDIVGLLADSAALTSVLDDMLVAADNRSVDAVPVDVASIADEVVDAARAAAHERGIELSREGEPHAVALASSVAVRRAVTALIDNAVGHARTAVEVQVATGPQHAVLVVEDDGPGLTGEGSELFRRFATDRAGAADPAAPQHYGLGLALVAEVAAQHGGRVRAGNRADGRPGAAITLELPSPDRRRRL